MKIKKNGKTINLTESDIKILSKAILKEQMQTPSLGTTGSDFQKDLMDIKHKGERGVLQAKFDGDRKAVSREMKKLADVMRNFHPELKNQDVRLDGALDYIFKGGKFNKRNMEIVCKSDNRICNVLPHPEVMEVLVKIV